MEIAHIVPTVLLNRICSHKKVQMCLAHQVLADQTYAEFYSSCRGTVIMDNSLMELGEAVDPALLKRAAEKINPDELVIPDVFRDAEGTIVAFENFWAKHGGPGRFWRRTFAVAHGSNRKEWLNCFDYFNNLSCVDTIGLPKVLDEIWEPGGRVGACTYLERTRRVWKNKEYHCLGIWIDPIEVLLLSSFSWIRSLDTALAVHAGLQEAMFDPEMGLLDSRPRRPHVYFEMSEARLKPHQEMIDHNTLVLEAWADGRTSRYP